MNNIINVTNIEYNYIEVNNEKHELIFTYLDTVDVRLIEIIKSINKNYLIIGIVSSNNYIPSNKNFNCNSIIKKTFTMKNITETIEKKFNN